MTDKREKIAKIIWEGTRSLHKMDSDDIADHVIEIFREELEKARKWDKVKELEKMDEAEESFCGDCQLYDRCDSSMPFCGAASDVVDAIEKEANHG